MSDRSPAHHVRRIVSGGQTGADRAALDVALALGIPCGGWCPQDRWAEDGVIPAHYPVIECGSQDPAARTKLNVLDSDATLILTLGAMDAGTRLTADCAEALGKPLLTVDVAASKTGAVRVWIETLREELTLNVAGPRESNAPGLHAAASAFLRELFA